MFTIFYFLIWTFLFAYFIVLINIFVFVLLKFSFKYEFLFLYLFISPFRFNLLKFSFILYLMKKLLYKSRKFIFFYLPSYFKFHPKSTSLSTTQLHVNTLLLTSPQTYFVKSSQNSVVQSKSKCWCKIMCIVSLFITYIQLFRVVSL